jgi:hypothetical protein
MLKFAVAGPISPKKQGSASERTLTLDLSLLSTCTCFACRSTVVSPYHIDSPFTLPICSTSSQLPSHIPPYTISLTKWVPSASYDAEDDFEPSDNNSVHESEPKRARHQIAQPSRAPRHRTLRSRKENSAGLSVRKGHFSIAATASERPSRAEQRKSQMMADLANLADDNAPPKFYQSDSEGNDVIPQCSSRRTRTSAKDRHHRRSKNSHIIKSPRKLVVRSRKKRKDEERLRDEI